MIRPQKRRPGVRAPRVTLSECVFATIQLENGRKIPGKLLRVSLTGGLFDLAIYVEERVSVSVTFPIGSGVVHGRATMLFPMRSVTGYVQPFRFTALNGEQLFILDREITALLKQTQGSSAERYGLGLSPPSFLLELL